ncbi:RmlC-like cupins superfamily protein [Abeliophyllum distichum]|uniref:RmlC-like cupins superfamily protein n=1 Tax=Abeliophyllum distichum TaxID=126358 RepID=A0ABD1RBG6_9LAMI
MGRKRALFLLVVVVCCALVAGVGGYEEEEGGGGGEEGRAGRAEGVDWFLLQDSKQMVKTDAGNMRVVRGFGGKFMKSHMHIGFITMEPRSLFIPQYLDSSLILFIRKGEARIGHIYKDDLVEKRLKAGDIYRIEAGSAFYLINSAEGQILHTICSIDTSESLGWHTFQSFFIGGGTYPMSILSGFDPLTLSTAFNVSVPELKELLTRQQAGPIVYLSRSHSPSIWAGFLDLEHHQKLAHLKRVVHLKEKYSEEKEQPKWSFRKLLISVLGKANKKREDKKSKGPDSYNIYDRKPDFKNNYGYSIALDESDYSPLGQSDTGIYLVNLSEGSMMAPHINPRATEYGIVLRGAGTIHIAYPNGSLAMSAKVTEGNVFWIPRYFPFCQIASRSGPFEFFGFTTSARQNRPQFLVGANSLLQTMRGVELATAFGVSEERLNEILDSQRESVILPSASIVAQPDETVEETMEVELEKSEMLPNLIRSFGNDMIMGFD